MYAEHVPVVVVGAGPAGLAAAIALARLGVETMLVERRAELSSLPRATAVSLRSMELIRSWGVEDAVRAGAVDVEWHGWLSGTLATVADGSMWPTGIPTREQAALLSPTAPACVPQDHLEPVLLEHLRSLAGTRVHLHSEVVEVRGLPEGVEVVLRDIPSGDVRTVRARYLVAADGARSAIRSGLGIAMRGPDGLGPRRHGDLPGASVAARRRAPLRRLLRQPPHGAGTFLPSGRGDRWHYGTWVERDVHPRATRRALRAADPSRRRRRRPGRLDRAHRRLQLRRPAGRPLPRRQRLPRRRRRPSRDPAGRHRDEHRDRQRARPGLEARLGAARLGRTRAARHLRGRTATDRRPQRRPLRRSRRLHARGRRRAARRPRRAHRRTCGSAPTRGACPRWTSWTAGSRCSSGPTTPSARRRGRSPDR